MNKTMVNGLQGEVIGIDLGGSAIKLGRFGPDGGCRAELTLATPQPATPEAVVAAIVAGVNQIDPDHQTRAIGLGTPGPADAAGRVARVAINLAGWQEVPIADLIEAQTGRPTTVANDANCAGLGEAWLGAGQSFQDVILLTLGTGVGGAIILDGQLFVGRQGTAGELGLITLNPDGPPCNSGNRGSLEQYCSVQAIQRTMGMTPAALYDLARAGDRQAIVFWQHYGAWLGAGLTSLIYVLTPEAIILGGGISAAWEFFLPATRLEVEKRVLPSSREGLQILIAELGNRAGMVGAARLAWQRLIRPAARDH
jgi:glucokinase